MDDNFEKRLSSFIESYVDIVRDGLDNRWKQIKPDIHDKHFHECIGALLSRQATLTTEMALAPSTWNGHIAPLFLRCMVDAYITFAWILEEPRDRSRKYIEYGLGQEKLFIEYLEKFIREEPDSYDAKNIQKLIEFRKSWLNSQLAEWAINVNVGHWTGISTREMAKEIGRESIYKYAYVPFSGSVHNMWQHVGVYNVEICKNPLHKWHKVPAIRRISNDLDYMYRSAKYMSLAYTLFDEKLNVQCDIPLPEDFLLDHPLFSDDEKQ